MAFSERKSQAIYDAVHEALMPLRIENNRRVMMSHEIDRRLSQAQHAAGMAAIAAYRRDARKRKGRR